MKQPPARRIDRAQFEASFPLLIDHRTAGDTVIDVYDTLLGTVVRTVADGEEQLEVVALSRRDIPKRAR